jgi:hypothetical protein
MTTDLERRIREALHEDAQHARLANPDEPPIRGSRPVSDLPQRARSRRVAASAAAALVVALVVAAVTIRNDDPSRITTTGPTPTPTTTTPEDRCPFTAEEVSEVIGETITGPTSPTECHFGRTFPSVVFDYLTPFACTPEGRSTADGGPYLDAVDGLGVDAYAKGLGIGRSLLVCNGDRRPFSVFVEGTEGDPLATAMALARLVLND